MSKRATKPATARRNQLPPKTRAKRGSKAPDVDQDDDDDDDDDSLSVDEEMQLFIRRPPLGADRLLVTAVTHSGDQTVQDRSAIEARKAPVALAKSVVTAAERWAQVDGRAVKFRATWMRDDRTLAAHQWTCGHGKDPTELDGTVDSFLQQQQRFAEAQHRLHLEGFEMVQSSWQNLLTLANERIKALEADNADLRERLRRVDDVGSEIALEQAKSEMEQRGRTADLLENRLLPIAQALLLQQAQAQQAADAEAAAAANGLRSAAKS